MIGGSDRKPSSGRRARAWRPGQRGRPRLRLLIAAAGGGILLSSVLAACGTSSASTGPVTLNFYLYPDTSGATQTAINNCDAQSHGKYKISYQLLPTGSDDQRLQLVRRLAAHDSTIDIMGLDVTWEPEFANAGWIVPWTGADKTQAEDGTLPAALDTAIWKGKLVAVPDNSNTQLLWYDSALVKTPPKTWAQMLADAAQLKKEGKPHYIEIQGAQYEGATVWFNTMVASAGGTILNRTRPSRRWARPRSRRCRSCISWPPGPPPTRRWTCRWRTRTGWPWRRARPRSS